MAILFERFTTANPQSFRMLSRDSAFGDESAPQPGFGRTRTLGIGAFVTAGKVRPPQKREKDRKKADRFKNGQLRPKANVVKAIARFGVALELKRTMFKRYAKVTRFQQEQSPGRWQAYQNADAMRNTGSVVNGVAPCW